MFKSIPLPVYVSWTFWIFWILHCLYSVACVFGPLISSGLDETQKYYQSQLLSMLTLGIFLPPFAYVLLKFVPAFSNHKWVCLVAPLFLAASIFYTYKMYEKPKPEWKNVWVRVGEEASVGNLTIRFDKFTYNSDSPPSQETSNWATFYISLKEGPLTGNIVLEEASRDSVKLWNFYEFSLGDSLHDDSGIYVRVRREKE